MYWPLCYQIDLETIVFGGILESLEEVFGEESEILSQLALPARRIILDSALGEPSHCLNVLQERIKSGQAVNDLNWLRLRTWRETLAMVFDPPNRRDSLSNIINLDIDIQGDHLVQGLLLASWIADKLG
jgi:glucose-6-phosphate dehydrogenase assembly protein OpcA